MNPVLGDFADTSASTFIVGDLRVDVGRQRVTRAGIEITVPNLSFQLFLALIRVAPNVLSNDLIMARVWPGLIVSPETVAKRSTCCARPWEIARQQPRYIAGIRSRGYRLIAPVSAVGDAARLQSLPAPLTEAAPAPAEVPIPAIPTQALQPGERNSRPGVGSWVVSSLLAIGLLAAAAFGIRAPRPTPVSGCHCSARDHPGAHRCISAHGCRTALRQHQR